MMETRLADSAPDNVLLERFVARDPWGRNGRGEKQVRAAADVPGESFA